MTHKYCKCSSCASSGTRCPDNLEFPRSLQYKDGMLYLGRFLTSHIVESYVLCVYLCVFECRYVFSHSHSHTCICVYKLLDFISHMLEQAKCKYNAILHSCDNTILVTRHMEPCARIDECWIPTLQHIVRIR